MPDNENLRETGRPNPLDYSGETGRQGLDYAGESPRITDRKEVIHTAADTAVENADHRLNHPQPAPEDFPSAEPGLDDITGAEFADFNPGLKETCENIVDYVMNLIQESAAAAAGFLDTGLPEFQVGAADLAAEAGANYQPVDAEIPHAAYTGDKDPRNNPQQTAAAAA